MKKQMDIRAVVGTDRLGRALPAAGEVPAPRKDKYVGIFYFICLDQKGTDGPYDVEKILAADPTAAWDEKNPLWGPINGAGHHWGEPLFGYYFTRDEWVIRKHIEMLSYADVDFLVFDTTNRLIYKNDVLKIMRILDEYVQAGVRVPKVAFMTNTLSGETVNELYREIYAAGKYPDTWFYWEGKPLIIGIPEQCSPEARDFFTFRISQWPNEDQKQDGFPWMEFIRPQRVFRTRTGEAEIINVSVAQHPNVAHSDAAFYGETDAWGRSYHNGAQDVRFGAVDWGFNVSEQWDYALSKDPKIIFLTGWNEWTAGRWAWDRVSEMSYTVSNEEGQTVHYHRPSRPYINHTFCDCCTEEYSRDIEPMKGGYFDSYYFQMISKIRAFKGMPDMPADEMPAEGQGWSDGISYSDYPFGSAHRSCRGFGKNFYENTSGVNDIREMTVSASSRALRFTASCAADVVRTGSWMRLFLNVGDGRTTAPSGYEYVANFGKAEDDRTYLAKWDGQAYVPVCSIPMSVEGGTVTLTLPRRALGIADGAAASLSFKWADQAGDCPTVEDFYTQGDTAPYGRLSYRYEVK